MDNRYIIAGAVQYAIIGALIKFNGRNWRRIKREMNKAARKARKR